MPTAYLWPNSRNFSWFLGVLWSTWAFEETPMPMPNLSSVSIDALLKLRDEVEKALSRRAKELQDQLSRLGRAPGLRGGGSSLKGRKVPVKFRDRSGNTWAGRGAQPVWLRGKVKAGAKMEDVAGLQTPKKYKK